MKKKFFDPSFKVGILGGGQLGRMMFAPALDLNVSLYFLDPNPASPCLQFCKNQQVGDFNDYQDVMDFGKNMDVISVEIEHVNTEALHQLRKEGKKIYPQPDILDIIKDKGLQKQWYRDHDIPTADFYLTESKSDIKEIFPFVQKMRKGGYDGKGVQVIERQEEMTACFEVPSVIEEKVNFTSELAVLVARNSSGEVKTFPAVGMAFDHKANLVSYLYSPAPIDANIEKQAQDIATSIITKLEMVGLLAIEFFLTTDGSLVVNEMAPRPHNSGHHTIEGNKTSQYEQFLRAILDLPLGETKVTSPAVMVNLLGAEGHSGPVDYKGLEQFLGQAGVHVHLYGKSDTKPYRKMGHVTIVKPDLEQAIALAKKVKENVQVLS